MPNFVRVRVSVLLLLVLAQPVLPLQGQNQLPLKTYIHLEAGPYWNMVKVDDPGQTYDAAQVRSSTGGLVVEQELFEDISVATGIYYQPSRTGINMADERRFQSRNEYYNALMIPFRLQYRIQPTDYPFLLLPRVGYVYSFNSLASGISERSSILSTPGGTAFSYTRQADMEAPSGHLLELGLGMAIRFSGSWRASLNLWYHSGVLNQEASAGTLAYTDGQGYNESAAYNTKGNGFSTTLSLHAPLSHVWQNKQLRIRSRVEGSAFDGKNVDRKGQLYLGGELGSLWRIFLSDNPAVGPRPMEGRGLFRHANLHTGIYAGYMLSDELGVDLGLMYQRSSSFFALMYDHEVDFSGKTGAPFYLEVPLRFRYFYPILENELFAVVNAGISLLTHFSGGSTSGPAGSFTYTEVPTQLPVNGSVSSSATRLRRFIPAIRLGIGAEYKIPIAFPMFATLYVNHMKGFMTADQLQISTSVAESPEVSTINYYGSGWSLDIGVKVPMSFDDRQDCVRLTRKKK